MAFISAWPEQGFWSAFGNQVSDVKPPDEAVPKEKGRGYIFQAGKFTS